MMAAIKWQDWPVSLPDASLGNSAPINSQLGNLNNPVANSMQVIRRMLQEFMSEQLLPFQVLARQDDRICYEIAASDKEGRAIVYQCHGRISASFNQLRLSDECVMRVTANGSRPVASIQEFLREIGPQMGVCDIALARYAREIEMQLHAEQAGNHKPRRNNILQEVLLLDGETALPFADLRRLDADGEALIGEWLAQHGTKNWIDALLEASLQPMIHLLYAHGIGIEADAANMVLMHRAGLPSRVALKELPAGLHMASQFSACAGIEPSLLQSYDDGATRGESSATQVMTQFYSATMLRNFGQLSIFLREYFRWPELSFWQQVAQCIYRYQDARPAMTLRFASFDLFAANVQVECPTRRKLLGESEAFKTLRNPLHRFRR